jgi:CPA2 family monovalent cation:H+ antiporter-2
MALLTEFLGLSLDLGAFFAGLMLAGTPYMKRTATAIKPLASVFAAMLFASIGMIINPSFFWQNLGAIVVVVVQIVLIKLIIVTTVVRLFNYSWKISIVTGIGLAHVGEFSLLFSSKLQAHMLLSRRAYLIFLAATVTTIVLAPLALRTMHFMTPKIMDWLNIPNVETDDDYKRASLFPVQNRVRAVRHDRAGRAVSHKFTVQMPANDEGRKQSPDNSDNSDQSD